jgi:membrane protein
VRTLEPFLGHTGEEADAVSGREAPASVSLASDVPAIEEAVARLPPRLRTVAEWLLSRWLGRFLMRTAASTIRIELFDRSMASAAQMFTSIFPILIVLGTWLDADGDTVARNLALPPEIRSVVDEAIGNDAASAATFGIVGTLFVVGSATSLSRALIRAYAVIWSLPRPRSRLRAAWRWAAAVIALAISLVAARLLVSAADRLPPPHTWPFAVAVTADVAIGLFLPWVLLAGLIRLRVLLPGALIFALAMVPIRAASDAWLPETLAGSASKYGMIGVAFTFLAWLYVIAFCFLAANIIGALLATDESALGRWIRGDIHSTLTRPVSSEWSRVPGS